MLPDRILDEIREDVRLFFGTESLKLALAAEKLADDGYTWDAMRPILSLAYDAGVDDGTN